MAYTGRALAGFAALALAALPCAAGEESISLVQRSVRAARRSGSSTRASAGVTSRGPYATGWPNPADPNMKANFFQKMIFSQLKAHPLDQRLVNASVWMIALTPVSYVSTHGGYDILFGALHNFADDSTVQMNAWQGLSDQSHTEAGSQHIADYGGPNKGIEYMVEQLKAHPTAHDAERADHLTYQYEVLQCISGLLRWDVNGTRGAAAVRAGLLEATVHALDVEEDLRPTVEVACNTLRSLLYQDSSYAVQLKELGAEELLQLAVTRYSEDDPTPLHFVATYGSAYPAGEHCGDALRLVLNAS